MTDETITDTLHVIAVDHQQASHGLCCAGCSGSWPCTAFQEVEAALEQLVVVRDAAQAILNDLDNTSVSYGHGMLRAAEHAQAILDAVGGTL